MVKLSRTPLPLVRLNLALPMLEYLDGRGIDSAPGLNRLSISRSDVENQDLFVSAPKMYQLVECLADLSGDPYFGVRVGENLDAFQWSRIKRSNKDSVTLGVTLLRFMEDVPKYESSVEFVLTVRGGRATLREERFTDGGLVPRHNDGFTVAYWLAIIRRSLRDKWRGRKVIAQVCDPDVIPPGYLGVKVAKHDTFGASVTFPASWLLDRLGVGKQETALRTGIPPGTRGTAIARAFRQAVGPHIHDPGFDVGRAAHICGLSKRTLARRLKANNTTAQKEIDRLRRDSASKALSESTLPIREIAAMVGYENPVVFSRAFKRWTGQLPSELRKKSRNRAVEKRGDRPEWRPG